MAKATAQQRSDAEDTYCLTFNATGGKSNKAKKTPFNLGGIFMSIKLSLNDGRRLRIIEECQLQNFYTLVFLK